MKKALRWVVVATALIGLILPAKDFIRREILPFSISMPPLDGKDMVDPRVNITLEALGFGAKLAKVEMHDENGNILAEAVDQVRFTLPSPLAFGARYTVKVAAERRWFRQNLAGEFTFTTVEMPKLESPTQLTLAPDASVTLRFSHPVGELQASGDLRFSTEPDESRRTIRLVASDYVQDKTYPVRVDWHTSTGVPLPPFDLEITTAPPLSAESNLKGMKNLGLAIPLQLTFSEPLADRAKTGRNIQVQTVDGQPINGKWDWLGQRRLRFTPQSGWPASETIEVAIDPPAIKSLRGGMLEKAFVDRFSTGSDRHIFVYLDAQRVVAVENGQIVRTLKASTGKAKTPTVTGSFYIYDRYPHKTMRSDVGRGQRGFYEVENVPYTQFFHKDYALHGAFWHNSFGRPASHGCVNLSTRDHNARWPNAPEDAGWLYRWASLGVPVTVLKQSPKEDVPLKADHGTVSNPEKASAAIENIGSEGSVVKLESPGISQNNVSNP